MDRVGCTSEANHAYLLTESKNNLSQCFVVFGTEFEKIGVGEFKLIGCE